MLMMIDDSMSCKQVISLKKKNGGAGVMHPRRVILLDGSMSTLIMYISFQRI